MDIVQQIIDEMGKRSIDATALSIASGVPQPTIWRTISRKTEPKIGTISKLCLALGMQSPATISKEVNLGFGRAGSPVISSGLLGNAVPPASTRSQLGPLALGILENALKNLDEQAQIDAAMRFALSLSKEPDRQAPKVAGSK